MDWRRPRGAAAFSAAAAPAALRRSRLAAPARPSRRPRPPPAPRRARRAGAVRAVAAPPPPPPPPDGQREAAADQERQEQAVPADDEAAGTGVQAVIDSVVRFANTSFDTLVWPVLGSCALLQDRWERRGGNFVLRPPPGPRPKAVLHFIGGAFVGAAPHIAYASLLSRLVKRGFVVVATPFDLSLDYLQTTGRIVDRWEAVETGLALDYGPLPVVGVGHSAGALFHALAASLFDDVSPKAGLVLVSFNNKPIKSAIPAFEQLVAPVARQAVELERRLPKGAREALESLPGTIDAAVEGSLLTPTRVRDSVLPLAQDARRVVGQLQPLVQELARLPRPGDATVGADEAGADRPPLSEFYPPPADIRSAISSMYSVEQTLVVKFRSDAIDESEVVLDCLMSRGGAVEVSMMELGGSHLTPLVQDLPNPPAADGGEAGLDLGAFGLFATGVREAASALQTKELYLLEALIAEWVDAGIENETL